MSAALAAQSGGLLPLAPASTHSANGCVTTEELGNAKRLVDTYAATTGMLTLPSSLTPIPFFPLAGRPGRDLFGWYYNDLDPTSGIVDFRCTPFTYDGHDATDGVLRSFGEMDAGVPIFAIGDGRVISTDDGHPDRNTAGNLQPNNYVIIDHGNGRVCYYWHMKKNSVAVAPKQLVRAGDQIGMCGSSGHSSFPHTHFATYENGVAVEPHSGTCQPSSTRFLWQPDWKDGLQVWDCAITRIDPTTVLPGITQNTSTVLQVANISGLVSGQTVAGTGIAGLTTLTGVDPLTSPLALSLAATGSGVARLTFGVTATANTATAAASTLHQSATVNSLTLNNGGSLKATGGGLSAAAAGQSYSLAAALSTLTVTSGAIVANAGNNGITGGAITAGPALLTIRTVGDLTNAAYILGAGGIV